MPNDLLMSFTASGGTDSAGNVYFQGLTVYEVGTTCFALVINGGSASWYTAPSEAGPWTFQGEIETAVAAGMIILNFPTTEVAGDLVVGGNITATASTITIPNGFIDLNMAVPANYPTSGKTLAQTQSCLDALVTSMINRELIA
jgi:hypothetical protein